MTRALGLLVIWAGLTGCGGPRDRTPDGTDGGVLPASDAGPGASGSDAAGSDAGGASADAGEAARVLCSNASGPVLVVTREVGGAATTNTTLLRIPLFFTGAASGISITSVRQLDGDGMLLRDWPAGELTPPDGFDGRAVPRDGHPSPTLVFRATAPALEAELDSCDADFAERAGSLDVVMRTAEGGEVMLSCNLGLGSGGLGPDHLPFRCARGVPGWLENDTTSVSQISTPIVATLVESVATVYGMSPSDITGLSTNEAIVSAAAFSDSFRPACTSPVEWRTTTMRQMFWRGMTSEDIWSGPVAPGTEERVFWFSQTNEMSPDGLCTTPDPTGTRMCNSPVTRIILHGTSSFGPFEWESDPFTCYRRG